MFVIRKILMYRKSSAREMGGRERMTAREGLKVQERHSLNRYRRYRKISVWGTTRSTYKQIKVGGIHWMRKEQTASWEMLEGSLCMFQNSSFLLKNDDIILPPLIMTIMLFHKYNTCITKGMTISSNSDCRCILWQSRGAYKVCWFLWQIPHPASTVPVQL